MRLYLLTRPTLVIFFLLKENCLTHFCFLFSSGLLFPLYNVRLHSRLSKGFDFNSLNSKLLGFFFAVSWIRYRDFPSRCRNKNTKIKRDAALLPSARRHIWNLLSSRVRNGETEGRRQGRRRKDDKARTGIVKLEPENKNTKYKKKRERLDAGAGILLWVGMSSFNRS